MNEAHLQKLATDYGFGEVLSVQEITEGILNRNYILETMTGKYFIKQVRDKSKDVLPYTAAIEEFMSERGIPAVRMLISKAGEKFVEYDSVAYSAYPFFESDRSHAYAPEEYRNMGIILAKMHLAGSTDIPELFALKAYTEKPKEREFENLQKYKERILSKETMEKIDEEFLDYIHLKLELIPSLSMDTVLENDFLTHGDYHAGNLLIDPVSREIIGICDWEKAEMASRAGELARAITYISFTDEYKAKSGLESAKQIIEGYNSVYPISMDELKDGFEVRLRRTVLTSWLENHYYDLGDARGNHFVPHETRIIRDFIQGDMVSKIVG